MKLLLYIYALDSVTFFFKFFLNLGQIFLFLKLFLKWSSILKKKKKNEKKIGRWRIYYLHIIYDFENIYIIGFFKIDDVFKLIIIIIIIILG